MSRQSELAQLGRVFDNSALSNRNLIINGAMQVSQRGDFTTAQIGYDSAYTVDRWANNGNVDNYKQHLKDVTVDGKVVNAFRMEAGLTYTGFMQSFQRIEDYKLLTGQVITISMWMRSNTTNARFYWYDGTSTFSSRHSGSGQWEKLTLTLTVSATISDYPYVLPCLNDETQSIAIQQGDYFEFTMVQVELGDTATPFEHRSYGQELALCERYLQTLPVGGGAYAAIVGYDGSIAVINLRQTMRASPSLLPTGITGYGSGNTEYRVYLMSNAGGGFAGSPVAVNFFIDFSTPTKVRIVCSHASGWYNSAYEVSGSFIDVGAGCKVLLEAEL